MVESYIFATAESPPLASATPSDSDDQSSSMLVTSRAAYLDKGMSLEGLPIVPIPSPIAEFHYSTRTATPATVTITEEQQQQQQQKQQKRHGDDTNDNKDETPKASVQLGAGIAAGIIGLFLGGPIVAAIVGLGTARASATDSGATGDIARAIGEVALIAYGKFQKLNQKHNLVEKGKRSLEETWEGAKELDRKHNILEKAAVFLYETWEALKETNRQYKLVDKACAGIGAFFSFMGSKINERAQAAAAATALERSNDKYQNNMLRSTNEESNHMIG